MELTRGLYSFDRPQWPITLLETITTWREYNSCPTMCRPRRMIATPEFFQRAEKGMQHKGNCDTIRAWCIGNNSLELGEEGQ